MQLHISVDDTYLEEDELTALQQPIIDAITKWIGEKSYAYTLSPEEHSKIGMSLKVKSKFKLKDPLNFLFDLAKAHQCEFVISIIDEASKEAEDICYFGNEEGKPDMFEVANYLGL